MTNKKGDPITDPIMDPIFLCRDSQQKKIGSKIGSEIGSPKKTEIGSHKVCRPLRLVLGKGEHIKYAATAQLLPQELSPMTAMTTTTYDFNSD